MAAFEKRVDQSGKVKYRAKIRIKGYPARSKTFERLTDAKRWARKTESKIVSGLYCQERESERKTFSDLIDRYLEQVLPKKSQAMQDAQYRQFLWWRQQLGPYLLKDITPALLTEIRETLESERGRLSQTRSVATCNRYIAALRHAFSVAERDWQWVSSNPAKKIRILREPPGRIRCLDSDEQKRLLATCKESNCEHLYLIVLLGLSTGMRLNEIKTLEWSQVKWAEGVLILYKTKNGRPRRVPLQGQAFIELRSYSKVRRIDSKLVFPSLNDSKRPTDIRWAWEKALEKAEILDFRFHDLRHTAASYFAMSGASARDLCEIFGWETMQMAMRYAHLFDSHTVEIAGRMSERFIEGK